MRIVSLLASATEIVCALGAGDLLVGRSHECDNPAWVRSLPPCTSPAFDTTVSSGEIDAEVRRRLRTGEPLYHVHSDIIEALHPDLLIAQSHCEVCAVTPGDVERSGLGATRRLDLAAAAVVDIFDNIRRVGRTIDREDAAEELIAREQQRLEEIRSTAARYERKSVVVIEWTDPLFVMSNWGPELVEIANGKPLLGHKGQFSTAQPYEALLEADPEYIIVAPCGFDLQRTLREQAHLEQLPFWYDLRAVRHGQVVFADGNMLFNRSGMTIFRTAELIAEVLHGCTFGDQTEGIHWIRASQPLATSTRGPIDENSPLLEQWQGQRLGASPPPSKSGHRSTRPDHYL
jgi:iron complex transport system substrate-binding protein